MKLISYGEDAQTVSEALELNLTSRSIGSNQRTGMCGFPANRLETYVNMLLDRGFDVAVSSLENGERNTRNIVSTNKTDPVQSQPVGRIDYLRTDGTVRESVEYTSPYQFEKDIKEENFYGVPLTIVFYKDKDGNTVPQDFISELDPPPQSIEIIDSPYLSNDRADEMLRQAEQIAAENTLPPDERFFVIETDEGYTFCTRLCENQSNEVTLKVIQEIMGHADISTTLDVYTDLTTQKKQQAFGCLQGKIKLTYVPTVPNILPIFIVLWHNKPSFLNANRRIKQHNILWFGVGLKQNAMSMSSFCAFYEIIPTMKPLAEG